MVNEVPAEIAKGWKTNRIQEHKASPEFQHLTTWEANTESRESRVAKGSKNTRWTFGTVNGYDTVVPENDSMGEPITKKAWIISSNKAHKRWNWTRDISKAGDSGCMIIRTD